ncbi:MAG TPA: hypothetical protein VFU56_00285 [Gaiellaceae bacterium]|nr:hypothetical protein [Gaiellaceae bacterium]
MGLWIAYEDQAEKAADAAFSLDGDIFLAIQPACRLVRHAPVRANWRSKRLEGTRENESRISLRDDCIAARSEPKCATRQAQLKEKGSLRVRKTLMLGVLAMAFAAVVIVAPASAGGPNGQTVTQTENIHGTFSEPEATNPCTGDTFNKGAGIQFTGNLINHVTFFTASDETWATFTETGAISGTDDGTGVTYSGRATVWGNFNLNERNQNSEFTLTIHATGSDGSSIIAHQTTAFVMNANGTVTVNFGKDSLTCG